MYRETIQPQEVFFKPSTNLLTQKFYTEGGWQVGAGYLPGPAPVSWTFEAKGRILQKRAPKKMHILMMAERDQIAKKRPRIGAV
jgi:hypothetical protein